MTGLGLYLSIGLCTAVIGVPTPLRDALLDLPFANSDIIRATDVYAAREAPSIYLEAEAPGYADWAWADGRIARASPGRPHGSHYYLFLKNDSAVAPNPPPAGDPPTANASMLAGWSVPPSGMRGSGSIFIDIVNAVDITTQHHEFLFVSFSDIHFFYYSSLIIFPVYFQNL